MNLITVEPHAEMITPKYFPNWTDGVRLVEECGRVSHKSEHRIGEDTAIPFVRKIAINYRHESILEHASFTACFIGSRAMSHQLVRHRLCAFTQESQRYCDYADDDKHAGLQVIVPPSIARVPCGLQIPFEAHQDTEDFSYQQAILPGGGLRAPLHIFGPLFVPWVTCVARTYGRYTWLREQGVPAEDARYLLPNATKTEVYVTANLREWRHIFAMRLDKHAQWEIKQCVQQVFDFFATHAPLLVEGLETHSGDPL